jgi:23S rRNA pseudouridine2605 synthase
MKNTNRPSRPKTAKNNPPSARPKPTSDFKSKDKPRNKPADKPTDRPGFRPKKTATGGTSENPRPRSSEKPSDKPAFRPKKSATGGASENPRPRSSEKSSDKPEFRPKKSATGGASENPRPRSSEKSSDKPELRPKKSTTGGASKSTKPRPWRSEESTDKPEFRPKKSDDSESAKSERPRSQSSERSTSRSSESPRKRSSKPSFGRKSNFTSEKSVFRPKIDKRLPEPDEDMRLNKYVALCGIAARRKASEMIQAGEVTVNGEVVTEAGRRVLPTDVVKHKGTILKPVEKMIYILLNKPKGFITTVTDDRGRKTVMDLVSRTVKERIFPVGRLDRDTTGLLVLTNDGDLSQKLSHPSYRIKKFYHVGLDKPLTKNDMEAIAKGIELEDGTAEVDAINYVEGAKKDEVMVEIHIGKNRIVRRIFESLGYELTRLDRVYYGGLTKKDLPRGDYRSLTDREVIMLKHFTGK